MNGISNNQCHIDYLLFLNGFFLSSPVFVMNLATSQLHFDKKNIKFCQMSKATNLKASWLHGTFVNSYRCTVFGRCFLILLNLAVGVWPLTAYGQYVYRHGQFDLTWLYYLITWLCAHSSTNIWHIEMFEMAICIYTLWQLFLSTDSKILLWYISLGDILEALLVYVANIVR